MHNADQYLVGVGLRHEHYFDALTPSSSIDFIEVHAENFFADGGAPKHLLKQACEHYQLSIHATSLGLGSTRPPSHTVLAQLSRLCEETQPFLVSDHACFNRAVVHGKEIHTGDLLPIRFNDASLSVIVTHIQMVQEKLKRTILLENLSVYLPNQEENYSEIEFLVEVCNRTGCKLLLDINNLLVNAHNKAVMGNQQSHDNVLTDILEDLSPLNASLIGEYHLAGTSPANKNEFIIDDHARPVSEQCWQLYEAVMHKLGVHPTLIEWDQDLPSWNELIGLAQRAKQIQQAIPQ